MKPRHTRSLPKPRDAQTQVRVRAATLTEKSTTTIPTDRGTSRPSREPARVRAKRAIALTKSYVRNNSVSTHHRPVPATMGTTNAPAHATTVNFRLNRAVDGSSSRTASGRA